MCMRIRSRIIPAAVCLAVLLTGCPRGSGQQDLASLPSLTTDDPQAESDLRAARAAGEAGRVQEAEDRYRRFLTEHANDPLVPVARLGLGRVLLGNGNVEAALEQFVVVSSANDPRVAEAGRFYRGIALHVGGRHAEALELLRPLLGRTVDPAETALLLRTVAAAAQRTGDSVVALGALDRLAGNTNIPEAEREQTRVQIREVARAADNAAIARAYTELPRDGAAWPEVAMRAMRIAFDAGDMPRVSAIVAELRERQVPMSEERQQLAARAERFDRADPRVIGAILPLTGRAREVGQRALRGLMLASGAPHEGPPGPDVPQLVLRDDAGDPERAARAVEDLVSVHRAIAIVGPLVGDAARAAARRAQELGVPMITLVPDPQITTSGDMVFRLFVSPRDEVTALVAAARARGAQRFAILRPQHAYGERMAAAFSRAVSEAGLTVVATEMYEANATSFGDPVRRLAAHQFDALFVPDNGRALGLIAPALAAGGLSSVPAGQSPPRGGRAVIVLAPSVAIDGATTRGTSRYLQGALFSSPFHAASAAGLGRAFVDEFQTRFNEQPDAFAAYAYDAFRLARRAVEAGQTTRAGLAAWLRERGSHETVGASGGLSNSRGPARSSTVLELRGEAFVAPSTARPARPAS